MLEQIKNRFKSEQHFWDGIIFLSEAGSHLSGTNDETSDLDFRAIVLLNEDYQIGMKKFEHTKLVSGTNKINLHKDLDVEVFSPQKFVNEAYHGETVCIEMLFTENPSIYVYNYEWMDPIKKNREVFLSKSIARKYLGYITGCINRALLDPNNNRLKRPDSIERLNNFGYETKAAMNAIKNGRMVLELLNQGTMTLKRPDREELLAIKRGKYTREEFSQISSDLIQEVKSAMETSKLPDKANFNIVNQLMKDYNKMILKSL
ncbi:putative nucleotidyltransferase [compost metagenome]